MAQRTVCLCDGKPVGIESIYTVINGQQINIPDKLKALRIKSQSNQLFCPCGCGANLILVAGDRNLREQHFRLKNGEDNQECRAVIEGKISVDSKIVLKCWLDDKLQVTDIESRVPIRLIDDTERKYEFSFLSRNKGIALSYCYGRANLSDEKFEILERNSQGIHIIFVVDATNSGTGGQYPEALMKIQDRQGYCLFLRIDETDYYKASMRAAFYVQNHDELWQEVSFAEGPLSDFVIDDKGVVSFGGSDLTTLLEKVKNAFVEQMEVEKKKREEKLKKFYEEEERKRNERLKRQEEAEKEHQRQKAEVERQKAELVEQRKLQEQRRKEELRKREEDFKQNLASRLEQQEEPVRDVFGNRWIKCEYCNKIAQENEFGSYGGTGHINLGTCYECSKNGLDVKKSVEKRKRKYDPLICPVCEGTLREKNGPFGKFMGCSNYPKCRYTRKIT